MGNRATSLPNGCCRSTASTQRRCRWPTIRFYAGFLRIVWSGYCFARKQRFDSHAWREHSWRVLRLVERIGGQIEASGFEQVEGCPGPKVYVANHMSMLETLIVPGLILRYEDLVVVLKKSLLSCPLFGSIVRQIGAIAVGRRSPREDFRQVLTQGTDSIRRGRSVLLFPQHRRSLVFDVSQFNSLGAKLAARARVPLVPVAVRTDWLGLGRWIRDFGRVRPELPIRIAVGRPVHAEGRDREAHRETLRFIREQMASWGVTVVESGREEDSGHDSGPSDEHSVR